VAVVLTWRYVSLASVCAAITFPVTLMIAIAAKQNWELTRLWPLLIVATVISILVVILHRGNIKRLLAGTENKIRSRKDRS
jgi:acyl phosphate:glycerol-3-phosphate acyltransferase